MSALQQGPAAQPEQPERDGTDGTGSSDPEDAGARAPVPEFDLDAPPAGGGAAAVARGARRRFDPNMAAQHTYLGDVNDLGGGGGGLLEEGSDVVLPLFALEGVVLLPGASLPLILHSAPDVLKLERALRVESGPTARLIAVTHVHRHSRALSLMGCSAEVRRMRREGAAAGGYSITLVARGRQRLYLDPASMHDSYRVKCHVVAEGCAEAPPRQVAAGAAFWAPWAARPFDAPALARAAQQQCSGVLPQIAGKLGPRAGASYSPTAVHQYSYWLAANLPLHDEQRQRLLEARDTPERLRLLLKLLGRLGGLACRECGAQVTRCRSALLMSAEGAGGAFVNAHGYVHDMATFRHVQGVWYVGRPETEHSWFPGYAWTIANCSACGEHLGWRFSAVAPDLQPAEFWGLRRAAIVCPELYGAGVGGGGAGGGGARGGQEGPWGEDDAEEEESGTEEEEEEESEEESTAESAGEEDGEGGVAGAGREVGRARGGGGGGDGSGGGGSRSRSSGEWEEAEAESVDAG